MLTQDSCHILLYTSKATNPTGGSDYLSILLLTALGENNGNRIHLPRPDVLFIPPTLFRTY
jgi:hypothetical protein